MSHHLMMTGRFTIKVASNTIKDTIEKFVSLIPDALIPFSSKIAQGPLTRSILYT